MNKRHILYLCLGICVISLVSNQFKTMTYPPDANHMWRQCDAYSMTLNYYNEKLSLLDPKMHFQASQDGRAVGEFPIIYYLQAKLWQITGPSFLVSRLFIYFLSVLGIVALFLAVFKYTKSLFSSYLSAFLLVTSPLFLFYSNSYMVNIPALSFLFIGWFFLLKYFADKTWGMLVVAMIFMTLSGLLRTTMLIGYLPFVLVLMINWKKITIPFLHKIYAALLLFSPFLINIIWINYSESYNAEAGSNYFLTSIRPMWECDNIHSIWSRLISWNLAEVQHVSILVVGLLLLLFFFTASKRQDRNLLIFMIALCCSIIGYLLLWFSNLDVHEYYLIELLMLIPVITVATTAYFRNNLPVEIPKVSVRFFSCFIILFVTLYAASKTRIKHDKKVFFLTEFYLDEGEIGYYQWYHWNYETKFKAFETIAPYLRKIGISKNDLVISLPDPTPNCTLSMMDQKGFTYLYCGTDNIIQNIEHFKKKGAKYLLMADSNEFTTIDFGELLNQKVGQFKNISIYKVAEK